jgi:hypothetical protein
VGAVNEGRCPAPFSYFSVAKVINNLAVLFQCYFIFDFFLLLHEKTSSVSRPHRSWEGEKRLFSSSVCLPLKKLGMKAQGALPLPPNYSPQRRHLTRLIHDIFCLETLLSQ